MSVRLVRQPEGTSLCGQACVAMAAGVSLDRAIRVVGHSKPRGTHTWEVVKALRNLGVSCSDRCRRISRNRPEYPSKAILVVRQNGNRLYHWVYYEEGVFYDPEDRWPRYDGWRVTSFLEIFG